MIPDFSTLADYMKGSRVTLHTGSPGNADITDDTANTVVFTPTVVDTANTVVFTPTVVDAVCDALLAEREPTPESGTTTKEETT